MSGYYAHYPDGKPIFLSDFVYYTCPNAVRCERIWQIDRVLAVDKDHCKDTPIHDAVIIKLQRILRSDELINECRRIGLSAFAAFLNPSSIILSAL